MRFAGDIICDESLEGDEVELKRWRYALERRGMKVYRDKTEYSCGSKTDEGGSSES